jgi:hypothetical protein
MNSVAMRVLLVCAIGLCVTGPLFAQVLGPSLNYTENFDSMGAAGTAPPAGWQVFQIPGASSTWTNSTGSNSVPAIGAIPNGTAVAGGTASVGLVANDNPTANQVNGYNATGASGATSDRGIATAPTGIAGSAIQFQISNGTGVAQNALTLSYDIRRYQVGADAAGRSPPAGIPEGSDELPGYWLFYSLDNGTNFTAVDSLIPVGAGPSSQPIVPNTVGITSIANTSFALSAPWNAGSNLILRWIDDNAIDPSPDEIIGIDNVRLAVPEPSNLLLSVVALLASGGFVWGRCRRET